MEEYEFSEPSFGEIVDLVRQYEESVRSKQQLFLGEENFEQIINFYQDNREYNKLLNVIETALQQYSFSSFFYTKKAEILANQKRFEEARVILEESEKLDPQDINIFLIRSDIYLWEGKHQEALEEVIYALTIAANAGDKCELYLEMADIYEDQEKYPEVIEALCEALKQDPMSEEGLNRLWFCTELTEKYEESIKIHEGIIDQSPYSHLAWFNLGHAHAGLNKPEDALEAFGYVMAIDESFDAAYISSGDVLCSTGKYDEAARFYMDAIRLSKPNKEVYLKLAECYERQGELSKSRSYLRKAITVDPYFDEAFYRIGESYRRQEDWTKAINSFERAVKLNRENVDYLVALGDAYMSTGDDVQAVEIFERIFQLDPQSRQNWINLATAYFNASDYRKAFQVLNEAEQKYENSADIFYIKSVFYNKAGNRHESLINLEKGLLVNFDEHTLIFEMDDTLLDDAAMIQVIEQYRS